MFGPVGSRKYLEYVGDIHSASIHLLEVIDAILDLAKVEAGQDSLEEEVCNVANLIRDAMRFVGPSREDLSIEKSIVPQDVSVFGDHTKLAQIITNLLSNAAKASEPEQTIEIDAASDSDGALRISVADQGPGIPANVMQMPFQPFRHSGDPYRQRIKGIGLGLVVNQRLAELHVGRVTLENEPGKGTVATLVLPAERGCLLGPMQRPVSRRHPSRNLDVCHFRQFFFCAGPLIIRFVGGIARRDVSIQRPPRFFPFIAFTLDQNHHFFNVIARNNNDAILITQDEVSGIDNDATAHHRCVDPPGALRIVGAGDCTAAKNGYALTFADDLGC
jgi:anti-sigma regulatory factor (Ser/Thr protein kinase)